MQLVIRDANQGPFLTQVLRFGRDNERLTEQQLAAIKGKAVLMSLKFADKYYNKYKMHLLEQAAHDVIGVVSLGLQELSARDPAKALALLQAPEGPIKPFQKGWSMLITVSPKQVGNSLYGDVDARLLDKISSPPDVEEWQGWQEYEKALTEHNKSRLMELIDQHFFACESDHPTMEDKLAEALLYRILCGKGSGAAPLKVKQDLKRRLAREIALDEAWFDTDHLATQLALMLSALPADMATALRQELSPGFVPNLLHTLGFVRQYQQLQKRGRLSGEARQHGDARRSQAPIARLAALSRLLRGHAPLQDGSCLSSHNARLAGRCYISNPLATSLNSRGIKEVNWVHSNPTHRYTRLTLGLGKLTVIGRFICCFHLSCYSALMRHYYWIPAFIKKLHTIA